MLRPLPISRRKNEGEESVKEKGTASLFAALILQCPGCQFLHVAVLAEFDYAAHGSAGVGESSPARQRPEGHPAQK